MPLRVVDPVRCKAASDLLLERHGIYLQPINYPTVPRGTECLRITPGPAHDAALMDQLIAALQDVWEHSRLRRQRERAAADERSWEGLSSGSIRAANARLGRDCRAR